MAFRILYAVGNPEVVYVSGYAQCKAIMINLESHNKNAYVRHFWEERVLGHTKDSKKEGGSGQVWQV